jgi:two-component system CheB/CheR fusion protein
MPNLLGQQLRVSAAERRTSRFQRFARDAPIGILLASADCTVQFANDEYLRIAGRTREEFDTDRARGVPCIPAAWLDPGLPPRHEAEWVRPDGTRVPVLVGVSRQEDGVAAFVVDLTAEKAAQRSRAESEERYRAAAEKLAEADRRKDEFFGLLSHELRNPLAGLGNALHLVRRASGDPGRAARALAVMERQLSHLTRLVDDLLDVARITRGRIHLRKARLDLAALARDAVEDHRAAFERLGVELVEDLPAAPVQVDGDATRLSQVLGNLLANSAKFTPEGGLVMVRLEVAEDDAVLEVRDTGEGIEADVLVRIFEPFSQGDRGLAHSRGGLGLGLTLVRDLVQLHGGTVHVSSAGRGAGTAVAVRLPRVAAPPPAVARSGAGPGAGAEGARGVHVLVVEDNPDAAETLRDALELEGARVTLARDGAAALAAARRHRPDIVVCDVGLPGALDGYAVARAMRADPAVRDTPLIALTGYAGPEDRERAFEAGFDRHLAKPSGLDELLAGIAALIRR